MKTQQNEVYKCNKGMIVEILDGTEACEFTCCGEPMEKQEEKTADKSTEKHVPVIEKIDGGYKVIVGTTLHPMEEDHYIQWIELRAGSKLYKEFLKPSDAPEAIFLIDAENVTAREYCNKHGLWKG